MAADDTPLIPSPTPHLRHLLHTAPADVRGPVMIVAFEGWNDAGDAATIALHHIEAQWEAKVFATIDPEEFYDFSETRPLVQFDDDGMREIVWPTNALSLVRSDANEGGTRVDAITLIGIEPQLRWRTFCQQITGLAEHVGARFVITLGALLAETPHSRPTQVFGTAYETAVVDELGLLPSRYQGPTGIVGVLHAACRDAGLRSASLWAAVPAYLSSNPSPKAALALVQKTAHLLDISIPAPELEIASLSWETQVQAAVDADPDTAAFVAALEARFDNNDMNPFDADLSLADEVEQFLREQRD